MYCSFLISLTGKCCWVLLSYIDVADSGKTYLPQLFFETIYSLPSKNVTEDFWSGGAVFSLRNLVFSLAADSSIHGPMKGIATANKNFQIYQSHWPSKKCTQFVGNVYSINRIYFQNICLFLIRILSMLNLFSSLLHTQCYKLSKPKHICTPKHTYKQTHKHVNTNERTNACTPKHTYKRT